MIFGHESKVPVMDPYPNAAGGQSRIAQMFANARARRMNAVQAGNDTGGLADIVRRFPMYRT